VWILCFFIARFTHKSTHWIYINIFLFYFFFLQLHWFHYSGQYSWVTNWTRFQYLKSTSKLLDIKMSTCNVFFICESVHMCFLCRFPVKMLAQDAVSSLHLWPVRCGSWMIKFAILFHNISVLLTIDWKSFGLSWGWNWQK